MTISEMHILFRVLGQQMGMQHVRGILPEAIDIYLNVAINEKCRSILIQNASTPFREDIETKDTHVSPVNALRTLYKSVDIDEEHGEIKSDYNYIEFILNSWISNNVFEYTSFYVVFKDYLCRHARLIEHDKISQVLRDYCNRATDEHPVVTLHSDDDNKIRARFYAANVNNIAHITVNFIQSPKKVSLDSSNPNNNVDCDLPEYLHNEIVQLAVQKYFQSIGATSQQINQ